MNTIKLFENFLSEKKNEYVIDDRIRTLLHQGQFGMVLGDFDARLTKSGFKKFKERIINSLRKEVGAIDYFSGGVDPATSTAMTNELSTLILEIRKTKNMEDLGDLLEYAVHRTGRATTKSPEFVEAISKIEKSAVQLKNKKDRRDLIMGGALLGVTGIAALFLLYLENRANNR